MSSMKSLILCLALLGQSLAVSVSDGTKLAVHGIRSTAANCSLYIVQSGDTCLTIAWANNVSYAQLIHWNADLDAECSSISKLDGDALCISNPNGSNYTLPTSTQTYVTGPTTIAPIPSPTISGSNADCGEWYLVESGQDCGTIETEFDISLDDFLFLNSEVWENCTNLEANVYYCVEAVGSISTYAGYGTTTATATPTFVPTNSTTLPWTNLLENVTTANAIIPLANGTRTDCYSYLVLSSDNYRNNTATSCWSMAMSWGVPPADFVLWNPSVDQNYSASSTALVTATASSAYTYPCTLSSSLSYCVLLSSPTPTSTTNVTAPNPRALGEASNCTEWGYVYNFTDCTSLLALYDLTIAELYAMNPSVEADCSGLDVGTHYCVSWFSDGDNPQDWGYLYTDTAIVTATISTTTSGDGVSTPSPVQTGIVSSCDEFYYVQQGDTCYDISQSYNISEEQLYAWNPAINNCADLDYGFYVCVGVLSSTSTATATAGTTTTAAGTITTSVAATRTAIITPTPTQSGMATNCDAFYDVEPGDGCYQIASDYSIALTDFYSWNAGISSCSDLWASYYVCVGTETASSNSAAAITTAA